MSLDIYGQVRSTYASVRQRFSEGAAGALPERIHSAAEDLIPLNPRVCGTLGFGSAGTVQ